MGAIETSFFPPALRKKIAAIHSKHPNGFKQLEQKQADVEVESDHLHALVVAGRLHALIAGRRQKSRASHLMPWSCCRPTAKRLEKRLAKENLLSWESASQLAEEKLTRFLSSQK